MSDKDRMRWMESRFQLLDDASHGIHPVSRVVVADGSPKLPF
ncbi:MAG TPA: hypothetical protein VGP62_22835 [Bryobacteraceae bacterium]|nr:hypothetical protein [Bryobacteraceae bacterium]